MPESLNHYLPGTLIVCGDLFSGYVETMFIISRRGDNINVFYNIRRKNDGAFSTQITRSSVSLFQTLLADMQSRQALKISFQPPMS